jgi:hypothetical protein
MQNEVNHLSRRALVKLAGITAAGSVVGVGNAEGESRISSLFDGKTLDEWIQIENSATSLSSGGITDPAGLCRQAYEWAGRDVCIFLRSRLQDSVKADLAAYSAPSANAKTVISALVKDINRVIFGPSIYDPAHAANVVLRPETEQLLKQNPHGRQLAR